MVFVAGPMDIPLSAARLACSQLLSMISFSPVDCYYCYRFFAAANRVLLWNIP
jgi:hypothetical protein